MTSKNSTGRSSRARSVGKPPISAAMQERIVDLARQGLARNAIAGELGLSPSTVSKYAAQAGVMFDRSRTRAATEAAMADSAAARAALAAEMLADLRQTQRQIRALPRPVDMRSAEQRTRAQANQARQFADITRAAPLTPGDQNAEVREAVRGFTSALSDVVSLRNKLEAYERLYGPIDDTPDTYGQVPAADYGREGLDDQDDDDERP